MIRYKDKVQVKLKVILSKWLTFTKVKILPKLNFSEVIYEPFLEIPAVFSCNKTNLKQKPISLYHCAKVYMAGKRASSQRRRDTVGLRKS